MKIKPINRTFAYGLLAFCFIKRKEERHEERATMGGERTKRA
jgi:hypothetical protein